MIHISKLNIITEKKDQNNDLIPFSFKAVTLSGEIIFGTNCICTSSHYESRSRKIKWLESGETRTIRNISFIEFNNVEVIF